MVLQNLSPTDLSRLDGSVLMSPDCEMRLLRAGMNYEFNSIQLASGNWQRVSEYGNNTKMNTRTATQLTILLRPLFELVAERLGNWVAYSLSGQ
jgi:hypothetical protein